MDEALERRSEAAPTFPEAGSTGSGDTGEPMRQQVARWIEFDDSRPSFTNEHLYTALAGAGFALCALFAPTRTRAVCHAMLSGMLLFRAASGRDGVRKWASAVGD